jgi:adenosylcobinamide hydrolase
VHRSGSQRVSQDALPGIAVHVHPEVVHVQSQKPLTTLSSSFYGGGFRRVRHILNATVPQDYSSDTPDADLRTIARQLGIKAPFVGLLTAVPMRNARSVFSEEADLRIGVLVTAGVGNATCAGMSRPFTAGPGTINIIALLDARLSHAAMANALITLTEAKCAVLQELDVRTAQGWHATGTSTDTVTVAMTGSGPAHPYAGPATRIGWLLAQLARQAVRESLCAA